VVSIQTNRLLLREFVDSDWIAVHEYSSDPEVCEYMEWGPNSVRETKEFLKRAVRAAKDTPRFGYDLAITDLKSRALLGAVGLALIGYPANQALIGYVLARQYWGQGIMSEAVKAMIGFGFGTLKLHRICAACDPRNVASYRVMERCGMRREAHFIEDKMIKGKWRDHFYYSVLSREWSDTRPQR